MRGISVEDALCNKKTGKVVITFDDGCETDLTVAAPLLQRANFTATFYITLGFLGRTGYLIPRQVRELSDAGFDIGCHSMTHPYLSDLEMQIFIAKLVIEDAARRNNRSPRESFLVPWWALDPESFRDRPAGRLQNRCHQPDRRQ